MIDVQPLAGALGAEIHGIDLTQALSLSSIAEIRQLLLDHQVIFFRNQAIDPAQHKALAEIWGPLQTHPAYATVPGFPEITILESLPNKPTRIDTWHSDMTFRKHPPVGTVLRSRIVPPKGGDTVFASMTAAYAGLSRHMQAYLTGLKAVHDFRYGFKESLAEPGGRTRLSQALQTYPPVQHPVIHTHPENGKQLIFVNKLFTTHIVGLPGKESDAILNFLYEHLTTDEYTCRFRWEIDSIAIWDNRATQHKPINDYFPAHRRMERTVIDGDRPY
ncbi:MAG: TauD/TfdA family dioxygenase [Bacteroidota bacterium]